MTSPDQHSAFADARNAIGRLLAAYQQVRAATGGVPRREDLGFEQLRPLLGWEFFAEWTAPESIVVRLSGAHIDYLLRSNVTGNNFFEKYRPEQRPVYSRFYGAIADHPCGGYTVRRVVVREAEAFQYHSIYLPLAAKAGYVPIVGAVAVTGFERLTATTAETRPNFQALSRLGLFDIGYGVPRGLDAVDIGAVVAEIDEAAPLALDRAALEVRPQIGRPRTIR